MIVVDASVMVSALWPDDPNHIRSAGWLSEQVRSNELLVAPIIILAEVAGAITRRTGKSDLGAAAMDEIQSIPGFVLVPIDTQVGLQAGHLAAELRIHGADAIYVAVADILKSPLATLDTQQGQRAAQRITALQPTRHE